MNPVKGSLGFRRRHYSEPEARFEDQIEPFLKCIPVVDVGKKSGDWSLKVEIS